MPPVYIATLRTRYLSYHSNQRSPLPVVHVSQSEIPGMHASTSTPSSPVVPRSCPGHDVLVKHDLGFAAFNESRRSDTLRKAA